MNWNPTLESFCSSLKSCQLVLAFGFRSWLQSPYKDSGRFFSTRTFIMVARLAASVAYPGYLQWWRQQNTSGSISTGIASLLFTIKKGLDWYWTCRYGPFGWVNCWSRSVRRGSCPWKASCDYWRHSSLASGQEWSALNPSFARFTSFFHITVCLEATVQ